MITSFDLEKLGHTISKTYISDGITMNDSLLKVADTHNLNLQQIHRVAEAANVDAYLNLIKSSEDKYVDFPLANAKDVYTNLTTDTDAPQTAVAADYENPPVKTASVNLFPGVDEGMEKVAENKRSYSAIRKEASYIEGVCHYIADQAAQTQTDFSTSYDKLWGLAKQATLTGENFNNIMEIVKHAAPNYASFIITDFTDYAQEVMPAVDISKEASYKGIINPKSPVYKACAKLEYFGERFDKIANAYTVHTDRYEELRKEASTLGGLKKLITGAGQLTSGITKGILKFFKKEPKILYIGGGGAAAYSLGKSKGKREQGALLQKSMLPSKYRNKY